MSALAFLDGIVRLPPPYDAERAQRGREDLTRWAATASGEAGDAIAALLSRPEGGALLDAVFGNSPFLARTLLRDAAELPVLLTPPPEAALATLLGEARTAGAADCDAMTVLRRVRRRVALLVALADIAGLWPLDRVCGALSDFADAALAAAVERLLREAARRGDLEVDPERPEPGSGLVVLAMGKHGAHELNYSSDIDIIVFFDRDCPYRGKETVQTFYVRLTQGLVRLLQHVTPEGYVFRTDLRLRPDPSATPAAVSLQAAEQYYESLGQNWERAAMIKARAAAGDIALGESFLAGLEPFVWRRNLDFAAIEDVHSIKRQIHEHRGLGSIAVEGHNIKLGRGGIRDIEFFVQTQQLIAGGRDPGLRQRSTAGATAALADAGWIAPAVAEEMMAAYRFHRMVEHRLQMVADEQTHSLPKSAAGIDHIARFAGYADTGAFRSELLARLGTVQRHYAQLFEAEPGLGEGGNLVFTGTDDDPDTLQTLAGLGFAQPKSVSSTVRGWHHGRYRAMRSARARELLTDLTPVLLKALAQTPSPDAAFGRFDRFLEGLPAGVQLFSMLKAQPALLQLLAEIVGSAPRLADYLSQNAGVLDAVLEGDFYQPLPTAAELVRGFQGGFRVARDMEDVLDTTRRVVKERKFQLGVQLLTGAVDGIDAGPAYAALADATLTALTPLVLEDFARRHGRIPGAELAVIGMGKLGSREMSAESDLDLLFIYDLPAGVNNAVGERPLAPGHYFARFSQRLVNALTAPTAEGRLYEVDMRLRPSGNAGPLAVGLDGFLDYQHHRAWTWEHMALTRARVITAPEPLRARIAAGIDEVLRRPRDPARLARDVVDMRQRIFAEKGSQDPWDLKQVRGGLIDLEFICQFLQLAHLARHPEIRECHTGRGLEKLAAAALLPSGSAAQLIEAWRTIHRLTALLRIADAGARFDPDAAPEGLKCSLAKAGGVERFEDLAAHLGAIEAQVGEAFRVIVEVAAG